jgi:uncharacterized membrane protein YphA (DoxX/SURF4 family)
MEKWGAKWREICGVDLRSLVLFRMGLALIILGDIVIRLPDTEAFYTDAGTFPRSVWISNFMDPWSFSFHLANGTWYFQILLFVLQILFALALLVGYKTKIAAVFSWIFLLSLHSRNSFILQGGDDALRLLMFWGLFLPLGAIGSLDASLDRLRCTHPNQGKLENSLTTRTPSKLASYQVVSAGSLGLLLQMCFIYWFAAFLKNDPTWWTERSAIWYSLSIEQYATPFGMFLLGYPHLLEVLSYATVCLEQFGPFFAFSPFWTGPLRLITAIVFILFHVIGLNLTMELALFPYVCAVGWLAFFPSFFWDNILKPVKIYFQNRIKRGTFFWNYLISIKTVLAHIWEWFVIFIYRFTPFTSKPALSDPLRAGWAANLLAGFFISYIFFWNVFMLDYPIPSIFPQWSPVASILRVDQYWNMFSPYPLVEDGWFVIPAQLRDGTTVDLFRGGDPVKWEKPLHVAGMYPNDRWRSYLMNMVIEDDEVYLSNYADYIVRSWNEINPRNKQIVQLSIVFMSKMNTYIGPPQQPQKKILWTQTM